jgi:ribosome maturation factor RimP
MRGFLSVCLIFCLGVLPAMPHSADENGKQAASIQEQINLLGVGTSIKVVLRGVYDGRKPLIQQGIIREIAEDHFKLTIGDQPQHYAYSQIETLELTQLQYKKQGQTDPAAVRRIVVGTGQNQRVRIKLLSNKKLTGTIQSFTNDDFILLSSDQQSVTVPFTEVAEIGPKKTPLGVKAAIAIGAAAGGLLILYWIWYQSEHN